MKWLIWREYRLNRLILITGLVLLLLPYVGALILRWWAIVVAEASHFPIAEAIVGAAIFSLTLSQLTMALLGGNAIAGERADRSAEFIAYLPLSRVRLLAGKLSLAFSAVVLIWGTNLLVFWILVSSVPKLRSELYSSDNPNLLYYIVITGLVFYGVSWLISSFQSSPTFAVGGGLITPLLVIMGLRAAAWSMDMDVPSLVRFMRNGCATIFPILAVACFSIGTWYYLKRVEP